MCGRGDVRDREAVKSIVLQQCELMWRGPKRFLALSASGIKSRYIYSIIQEKIYLDHLLHASKEYSKSEHETGRDSTANHAIVGAEIMFKSWPSSLQGECVALIHISISTPLRTVLCRRRLYSVVLHVCAQIARPLRSALVPTNAALSKFC